MHVCTYTFVCMHMHITIFSLAVHFILEYISGLTYSPSSISVRLSLRDWLMCSSKAKDFIIILIIIMVMIRRRREGEALGEGLSSVGEGGSTFNIVSRWACSAVVFPRQWASYPVSHVSMRMDGGPVNLPDLLTPLPPLNSAPHRLQPLKQTSTMPKGPIMVI